MSTQLLYIAFIFSLLQFLQLFSFPCGVVDWTWLIPCNARLFSLLPVHSRERDVRLSWWLLFFFLSDCFKDSWFLIRVLRHTVFSAVMATLTLNVEHNEYLSPFKLGPIKFSESTALSYVQLLTREGTAELIRQDGFVDDKSLPAWLSPVCSLPASWIAP